MTINIDLAEIVFLLAFCKINTIETAGSWIFPGHRIGCNPCRVYSVLANKASPRWLWLLHALNWGKDLEKKWLNESGHQPPDVASKLLQNIHQFLDDFWFLENLYISYFQQKNHRITSNNHFERTNSKKAIIKINLAQVSPQTLTKKQPQTDSNISQRFHPFTWWTFVAAAVWPAAPWVWAFRPRWRWSLRWTGGRRRLCPTSERWLTQRVVCPCV